MKEQDPLKTYRYLRIGMVGAVVLLATSILLERSKVDCWQTSVSAYYYTPVRAIFVGCLMAVGLALIVYKGRYPGEDPFLNFAGMLAPVVAIAPTTDVGSCWSVQPEQRPVTADGSLAPWVVDNIDNNFNALLIAGTVGLFVAVFVGVVLARREQKGVSDILDPKTRATTMTIGASGIVLLVAWLLSRYWNDFDTRAHGYAAVGMFALLIGAIIAVAVGHWEKRDKWFWRYAVVALLMLLGVLFFPATRVAGDHTVLWLEAYERSSSSSLSTGSFKPTRTGTRNSNPRVKRTNQHN
jgi:hypothetical protein